MMRWQHQHRDVVRRSATISEPIEKEGPLLSQTGNNDPVEPLIADPSNLDSLEPSARLEAREPVYSSPGNTYGTGSTSGGQNGDSSGGGSGGSGTSSGGVSSSTCKAGDNCSQASSASTNTLPIVLGVVIPIVVAAIVFIIVIQKRKSKQRVEDMNDKHGSLDFGMGEVHRKKGAKKGGKPNIPEMTVTDMSTEKMLRGRGISVDLGSPYVLAGELQASKASFDSASRSIHDDADPYRPVRTASKPPVRRPATKADSEKQTLLGNAQTPSSNTPRSSSPVNSPFVDPPLPAYNGTSVSRKPVGPAESNSPPPPPPPPKTDEDRKATSNFSIPRNIDRSSISSKSSKTNQEGGRKSPPPPLPTKQPRMGSIDAKVNDTLPADGLENYNSYTDMLGISGGPQNTRQPPAESQERGGGNLAVPTYNDPRRLSASVRPLPPEDPTDNAEQRANRIRSFYKEYFDDSKPQEADQDYYGYGDYSEDYGQEHLDGAAIWDPETGQFVTAGAPFGEPMTRRAMTPPPRGPPRFRPGAGGHRYTSSSGHSHGPRGRAHSSASNRHPGARGRPVKKLPPPKPLNNLPTPHHLKDNMSFLPAGEFAPPMAMRDRIAGRADSPHLEQRPYSPSVRAFTPLKSSFKELTVMPSPHALRRSGTFTALDFAPPPKINDFGAGGSDTSSIRSGRSGISAVQAHNVRAGNYRVSRIGNNNIGTKDDLAATLRPQWNIGR